MVATVVTQVGLSSGHQQMETPGNLLMPTKPLLEPARKSLPRSSQPPLSGLAKLQHSPNTRPLYLQDPKMPVSMLTMTSCNTIAVSTFHKTADKPTTPLLLLATVKMLPLA